jgi:glucosyl-3-phosphoglycerate synthase
VARRPLLDSIPFWTGYAVETGMLIDVLGAAGLDAMAQVGLGARRNQSRALRALGSMSFAVATAIVRRSLADGRLISANGLAQDESAYVRAVCTPDGTTLETEPVELVERPPMAEVTAR